MPATNVNRSSTVTNQDSLNPLFQRNYCRWPSCDTLCSSLIDFNRHVTEEHSLDDRSVAQARVQQHVVQQLEALLTREREILQAMMKHLHGGSPPSTTSNGATSSNANSTATHIVTQPATRTLTPYHLTRTGQLASLSSPASSSSSINNTSSSTGALHHLPIVKLENAFLTSTGVVTAGTGATTSHILRASASSSPPPVHTVEEEVGDDIPDDDDDDDDDMDDTDGGLSRQTGSNGSMLPLLTMDKHRIGRKTRPMLALGGKKAGKGKGKNLITKDS